MRRAAALLCVMISACAQAASEPTQEPAPSPKNTAATALENSSCIAEGQWTNDRGSAVTLRCTGAALSGVYNTNVGQPDKGQSFPLTGWIEGDNLTFTVNFKGYGSITAWAGQIESIGGEEQLKTLWHLTRDVDEAREPEDMWKSITAGASVFTRMDAANAERP